MISIEYSEPSNADWVAWRHTCLAEQERLNRSYEDGIPIKVKERIYKGPENSIKRKYFISSKGLFYGKCAFCEEIIYRNQPGDIEHFRPKLRVDDLDGGPVMIGTEHDKRKHPGYYWLIYDWHNLLASCRACNSSGTDTESDKKLGKRNYFPVKEYRASEPGDEVNEEPLLINPTVDEPGQYFSFLDSGQLEPINDKLRGRTTIDILRLNDRGLPEARYQAYHRTLDGVKRRIHEMDYDSSKIKDFLRWYRQVKSGKLEFSIAVKKAIKDYFINNREVFAELANIAKLEVK